MNEFAIAEVTTGRLNALVKNLMCQMGISNPNEAVRLINSGEWVVSKQIRQWREENGVIYFSVTSDGTTGPQWKEHLANKGVPLSKWAKDVLNSPDFIPTNGVKYEIAVFKGVLFEDDDRTTKKIRAEADRRDLTKPNAEVACLILEMFTKEEIEVMGLWWLVVMHDPINDSDGDPRILSVSRLGDGCSLGAGGGGPVCEWDRGDGFVFVVSQVSLGV